MSRPNSSTDNCIETVDDSKPKVAENGRKAVFLNPERCLIKKVKVDGCLIESNSPKADYIVSKPGVVDVIVELKGKDIAHAKDQIVATLPIWKAHPPFSTKIVGLIICSRSPLSSSDLQVLKAKVKIRHRLTLIVEKNGEREYDFGAFE